MDIWPGAIHNISIGCRKTRGNCCIACVLRPRIWHKKTRRHKTKFLEVGETKAKILLYLRKHPILTDLNWKIFIGQVSRETVPIALHKDSGYHTGTWSSKSFLTNTITMYSNKVCRKTRNLKTQPARWYQKTLVFGSPPYTDLNPCQTYASISHHILSLLSIIDFFLLWN